MITVGIIIDKWMLPFYTAHLSSGNFTFHQIPAPSSGQLILVVEVVTTEGLTLTVDAAEDAARRSRMH